ncbi:hypothetical protein HDC37_002341 [Microbacterium sp. AK009]|uniref:hypothetical protein n=1 Tax=Microbacterium sp. AK009 TaxID=2723068 RepID=UPI0015C71E69|nr:hypothetical protein [Microbacterium sp. AK009]NYF17496.1 hypothetical protein [Microbacterium sp. AK009]
MLTESPRASREPFDRKPLGTEQLKTGPLHTDQFELVRLAAGGWVITDLALPHDDPACLLAYVQDDGSRFEVVWVQPPVRTGWFDSLDEILDEARARRHRRAA